MTSLTKRTGVPTVPAVPTSFNCPEGNKRAINSESLGAVRARVVSIQISGDSGDSGDSIEIEKENQSVNLSPLVSPLVQAGGDTPIKESHRELLGLPVKYLALLPLPGALQCRVRDLERTITLTSSRGLYSASCAAGSVVFSPVEFEAVALAAEQGRAGPADFQTWIERKSTDPTWRLTPEEALAGAAPHRAPAPRSSEVRYEGEWFPGATPAGWTFARLFASLGLELLEVDVVEGS